MQAAMRACVRAAARAATFIFAVASTSAAHGSSHAHAATAAPASPAPPDPGLQYSYYCRADSSDGQVFYATKTHPAFQGKYDDALVKQYSTAWTAYMNKTYGEHQLSNATCDFTTREHVDGVRESFVKNAGGHRIVDVDWQYTPTPAPAPAPTGQ